MSSDPTLPATLLWFHRITDNESFTEITSDGHYILEPVSNSLRVRDSKYVLIWVFIFNFILLYSAIENDFLQYRNFWIIINTFTEMCKTSLAAWMCTRDCSPAQNWIKLLLKSPLIFESLPFTDNFYYISKCSSFLLNSHQQVLKLSQPFAFFVQTGESFLLSF